MLDTLNVQPANSSNYEASGHVASCVTVECQGVGVELLSAVLSAHKMQQKLGIFDVSLASFSMTSIYLRHTRGRPEWTPSDIRSQVFERVNLRSNQHVGHVSGRSTLKLTPFLGHTSTAGLPFFTRDGMVMEAEGVLIRAFVGNIADQPFLVCSLHILHKLKIAHKDDCNLTRLQSSNLFFIQAHKTVGFHPTATKSPHFSRCPNLARRAWAISWGQLQQLESHL